MSDQEQESKNSSDSDYDPQFTPIISLPEVETPTMEEEEEEIFGIRARIYRYATEENLPEWKERGTGELKFVKHRTKNTIRIIMRRDKTLKVCANHFITPYIQLKPMTNSDRAFVYSTLSDFSDEEAKTQLFAIRFGSFPDAELFKENFNRAVEIILKDCELYNGEVDKIIQEEIRQIQEEIDAQEKSSKDDEQKETEQMGANKNVQENDKKNITIPVEAKAGDIERDQLHEQLQGLVLDKIEK